LHENLIVDAKAVSPYQATVFFYPPSVENAAGSYYFSVRRTPQHQPLKCEQFCSRKNFYLCHPLKACPIENDGFLR
jgi:hypothetical protein